MFPRKGREVEATLVNIAGGITGGDQFDIEATVQDTATLTLATQSCERIYRAQPDSVGRLTTKLTAGAGARLNWLPQETILFDGCDFQRNLRIEKAPSATVLAVEALVFGRKSMGEDLNACRFRDRIEIWQDGTPLAIEALRLDGDVNAQLAQPYVAGGAGAMATILYASPDADRHLDRLRGEFDVMATCPRSDLMILRFLAEDSFALRQQIIPPLRTLKIGPLPIVWSL